MFNRSASNCIERMSMGDSESLWHSPQESLILGDEDVHVWRVSLDIQETYVQFLELTLATDEYARAAQFRFQKDRKRFIIARGVLRAILGRYLAKDPQTLRFCYNNYGKPFLIGESASEVLCFNMTHSHGMALYAVTQDRDIGIDLEYIDTSIACEQIAVHCFSPNEVHMFRTIPASMQHNAFFSCWTRKEAYLKARGTGLSLALSQFDVSVIPGAPAALLDTREEGQDSASWSLYDLSPDPHFAAALAVNGHPRHLEYWQWHASTRQ